LTESPSVRSHGRAALDNHPCKERICFEPSSYKEINTVLRSVHRFIGGKLPAVYLFRKDGKWLVNEVNDGGEFRNS
jgi:[lysine-biosynthesis-protein LysW]--L-2-aminoadipate ligase